MDFFAYRLNFLLVPLIPKISGYESEVRYRLGCVTDSDLINFNEVQILQYTRGGAKVSGFGYMAIFFALKNKLHLLLDD